MSWKEFGIIQNELDKFEDYLQNLLDSRQSLVKEAISNLAQAGGKRIRPALIITIAHLGNYKQQQVWNFAATIEILHMATLIHDDIIDESHLRRGSKTVQSKYGKDRAVFAGDYLFSLAFNVLSDQATSKQFKIVTDVINKICESEIQQYQNRYNYSLSYRDYYYRIKHKTALLFESSCALGAENAGFNQVQLKKLAQYGRYLGMAFQLTDDLLDFKREKVKLGKPNANDFTNGIYTLPLLYVIKEKECGQDLKELLSEAKSNKDEIREFVIKNGGVDYTLSIAKKYIKKAQERLEHFPNNSYRMVLTALTDKILAREF